MANTLAGRDVIAIGQLTKAEIELVLAQAARFEERCHKAQKLDLLPGKGVKYYRQR